MEVKSKKRVLISLPKRYMAALAKNDELDHRLVLKELNPYVNAGYVRAYFTDWGVVAACKVKKSPKLEENKSVAYVRFSVEDEADGAEWASPHYIGGDMEVKRVVSPKMEKDSDEVSSAISMSRPWHSMGLGYILEDAQWLDELRG